MIGVFDDNDGWLLADWKTLPVGVCHVPANNAIIFADKMDLRDCN